MVQILGYEIPDDVYNSLVQVVETERSNLTILNSPQLNLIAVAFPFQTMTALPAIQIINNAMNNINDLIQQTAQQLINQAQQAESQGYKVTAIDFTMHVQNTLLIFAQNTMDELTIWFANTVTDQLKQALQAGVNQFNNDTLPKANAYLSQQGWRLEPLTAGYDDTNNVFYIKGRVVATGSPIYVVIIAIVIAIVAIAIVLYLWHSADLNYNLELQKLQTVQNIPQIVAKNVQDVLTNCVQTTNDVQFCEKYAQQYLSTIQSIANQTLQQPPSQQQPSIFTQITTTVATIAGIAIIAGIGLVVLSYLRKRSEK